jgi:hypothetical protein
MITYAVYGFAAWNGYQASYQQYEKNATSAINEVLSKKISSQYLTADKLADIRKQALSIKKTSVAQCNLPAAAGWLTVNDGVRRKADDCSRRMRNLTLRAEELYEAGAAMEIENRLAGIVQKAAEKSKGSLSPENWQSSYQVWADAVQDTENLPKGQKANSEVNRILTSMRQIEAAWKRIIDANEAQDEPGFEDAKERLIQGYAELVSLPE